LIDFEQSFQDIIHLLNRCLIIFKELNFNILGNDTHLIIALPLHFFHDSFSKWINYASFEYVFGKLFIEFFEEIIVLSCLNIVYDLHHQLQPPGQMARLHILWLTLLELGKYLVKRLKIPFGFIPFIKL